MIKKNILIGIGVGVIANIIGLIAAATILGQGDDFVLVIKAAAKEGFTYEVLYYCRRSVWRFTRI